MLPRPTDPVPAPPLLVSHALCPYVQRAAIVLAEKGVRFERRDVDLAAKPDWFLRLSPLGRTPVLIDRGEAIFESAVICEYLDETVGAPLLPADPLARARQRAWVAFASAVLDGIAGLYGARDEETFDARVRELAARFAQVEAALGDGPWFAGPAFGLVDAAFAPVFRYFDAIDAIGDPVGLAGLPRTTAWRRALAGRPSVAVAVRTDFPTLLAAFLRGRGSVLSRRLSAHAAV